MTTEQERSGDPELESDDSRRRRRTGASAAPLGVQQTLGDLPVGYAGFLAELKSRVDRERLRVVIQANASLVLLYWDIGTSILMRQAEQRWGVKVIDRLSSDLRVAFPDMRGFSTRNLKYMRAFAAAWPDNSIVQAVLAQLTWYHNIALIERIHDPAARVWYARQAIEHGWSRNVLAMQIERGVHVRRARAVTNFDTTLPPGDSDLASDVFKDPYLFDFLGSIDLRREREVERALVDHVQQFLLELGAGFAFVGRQVHLEIEGEDSYIDLLFYHLKLRCFVVVELKTVPFEPEFAGKLNFYLSAVDDLLRHADDKPSIGLLLCRSKQRLIVEYALRDMHKPIGVSEWKARLVKSLPRHLEGSLPTVEQFEAELARDDRTRSLANRARRCRGSRPPRDRRRR